MKSYKRFLEIATKKVKSKKPKVKEGDDKPEDYEYTGSEDEHLHEPGDTGV